MGKVSFISLFLARLRNVITLQLFKMEITLVCQSSHRAPHKVVLQTALQSCVIQNSPTDIQSLQVLKVNFIFHRGAAIKTLFSHLNDLTPTDRPSILFVLGLCFLYRRHKFQLQPLPELHSAWPPGPRCPQANQAKYHSYFSLMAPFNSGVHHLVWGLPLQQALITLQQQLSVAASTIKVQSMVHLDSKSLASLRMLSMFCCRLGVDNLADWGLCQAFPAHLQ